MIHLDHSYLQKLFEVITNAVSTLLLLILFYILQYVLDMDFTCSCIPGVHANGVLYLAAPPAILTWVIHVIESFLRARTLSRWQSFGHDNIRCYLLKLLLHYLCLSTVWISTVLLDGDWYFCLMTNLNATQTGIPCKQNLTFEEIHIKAYHKTTSLAYGFGVILGLIGVWILADIFRKKTRRDLSHSLYYKVLYEELLKEQVSSYLKDELRKIAIERAKALCNPHLQAIKNQERLSNRAADGSDNVHRTVLDTWKKISHPDFCFSELEMIQSQNTRRSLWW